MSLEYKPSLGFVETAGLVIAIQVADAMAKAAEVEIISAHKVDGLRVCVICKEDAQKALQTATSTLDKIAGKGVIHWKKAARKAAKLARMAAAKGEAAAPAAEESPKGKAKK